MIRNMWYIDIYNNYIYRYLEWKNEWQDINNETLYQQKIFNPEY